MFPILTRLNEIENKLDMLIQEQQTYRGPTEYQEQQIEYKKKQEKLNKEIERNKLEMEARKQKKNAEEYRLDQANQKKIRDTKRLSTTGKDVKKALKVLQANKSDKSFKTTVQDGSDTLDVSFYVDQNQWPDYIIINYYNVEKKEPVGNQKVSPFLQNENLWALTPGHVDTLEEAVRNLFAAAKYTPEPPKRSSPSFWLW